MQSDVKIEVSQYVSVCCKAAPDGGLWYDPTAAWMGREIVRYGKCSKCGQKAAFQILSQQGCAPGTIERK